MRTMISIATVAALLLLAGQSSAITYYGEIYTSELAGDVHADIVADIDYNPLDLMVYDTNVSSPGLGDATIPPTKTIDFSVDPTLGTIEKAWLYIGLTDDMDPFYDPYDIVGMFTEVAVIEFSGTTWTDEVDAFDFLISPVLGDVTAELLMDQTSFVVSIASDPSVAGDFQIVAASLKVQFGDPAPGPAGPIPAPEPNAALLFAVGTLVVGSVHRRR